MIVGVVPIAWALRRKAGAGMAAVQPAPEWRRVRLTRLAGTLAGIAAAAICWEQGSFGRGPMLAPALFGLGVVLGVGLGETVVQPPRAAGVRSASLRPRRIVTYLPRTSTALSATMLVLTTGLLVFTTLTASLDDATHSMRAISCSTALVGSSSTPYPGSFYSLPLALLLVSVLVVAGLASRQVIVRPRGLATDDVGDDALRRRSLDVVVSAVGIAVSAPYIGVALTAGGALQNLGGSRPSCAPVWMEPVGVALTLSTLLGVVVAFFCLTRLTATGAQRIDRPTEVVGS